MDDVNSTEDNTIVSTAKLSEPPTSMSKRQLKRLQRKNKWLERRSEKRLGILLSRDNFVASFYLESFEINLFIHIERFTFLC